MSKVVDASSDKQWHSMFDDGPITYLQLGLIGSFLARTVIGYVLVPVYYEREIYSPYDYMGNALGQRMKHVTTALFSLGGVPASDGDT